MGRYLRSLRAFWVTALAAEFEYPTNFAVELLAVALNLAGSVLLLSLFFGGDHRLGGWSWQEALVVLGVYTVLEGFTTTLLQPNLSRIVTYVQEGTLDFILIKPIDSQFWVSARHCSPWGLPGMAVGLALALWASLQARSGQPLPAGQLVLAVLLLVSGLVILYGIWFVLAACSIWFVKVWNATEVLRSTLVAGRYPISAYPPLLRAVFTVVLPVAFLTTVPAEAFLGQLSPAAVSASLTVAALTLVVSRAFWRFALRFYTSASS